MQPSYRAALWALLLGNFVIGTGVMAPAALIHEIGLAFVVDPATVGTLIAYGGALLCIEAPLLSFATNRLDRRHLLAGALALFAVGNLCSALAPDFSILLAIRLVMIAAVAVFTPQAASSLGLFLPAHGRAGAITFIFLGWSLSSAIGIPLINLLGSLAGWQAAYCLLGLASGLVAVAVSLTLPAGLKAHRLSLAAWGKVLSSGRIWCILILSGLAVAGQNMEYPYIVVKLKDRLEPDPTTLALLLSIYGIASITGTAISSRVVNRLGTRQTVNLGIAVVLVGMFLWTRESTSLALTVLALLIWGAGISPAIAAQQARLVEADPAAASASVSMNTSVVYLGQALGAFAGGKLLIQGQTQIGGGLAMALLAIALVASMLIYRRLRL